MLKIDAANQKRMTGIVLSGRGDQHFIWMLPLMKVFEKHRLFKWFRTGLTSLLILYFTTYLMTTNKVFIHNSWTLPVMSQLHLFTTSKASLKLKWGAHCISECLLQRIHTAKGQTSVTLFCMGLQSLNHTFCYPKKVVLTTDKWSDKAGNMPVKSQDQYQIDRITYWIRTGHEIVWQSACMKSTYVKMAYWDHSL